MSDERSSIGGNVLIVDDDEALADNLAEIVDTIGARITTASDRKDALARATDGDFDVALVDVQLPDGDGISLLAPLRERSPFVEIVLMTGNATLDGAMAAVRGGAFAYVMKPFSPPGAPGYGQARPRPGEALSGARAAPTRPGAVGAPQSQPGRVGAFVRAVARRGRADHVLEPAARGRDRPDPRQDDRAAGR